jgi:hypothetical protein
VDRKQANWVRPTKSKEKKPQLYVRHWLLLSRRQFCLLPAFTAVVVGVAINFRKPNIAAPKCRRLLLSGAARPQKPKDFFRGQKFWEMFLSGHRNIFEAKQPNEKHPAEAEKIICIYWVI